MHHLKPGGNFLVKTFQGTGLSRSISVTDETVFRNRS